MVEEKDFKIVDKRSSSQTSAKEEKGEGFIMKESGKNSSPTHDQIDFSTFLLSLATSALIQMGLAPDPMTKKTEKNLDLARQNIELLTLLQVKTKGNLTPDESKLIENLLTEVRVRYVQVTKTA